MEGGFHGGEKMDFIERKGGRISWMDFRTIHHKFTFTFIRWRLVIYEIILLLLFDVKFIVLHLSVVLQ